MNIKNKFTILVFLITIGIAGAQQADRSAIGDEAVRLLQEYIRVETVNPPGNESQAVEFLAKIFTSEGIDFKTAESSPGRGNIWATLKGGSKPALVLIHHSDVVPVDQRYWTTKPFGGEIIDGFLYGRGAMDTKGGGIAQLVAFLTLKRLGLPLNRDVVYMATADEEAGGFFGAGWLAENRRELFANVGLLLNEGGSISPDVSGFSLGIEVTQKVPVWLRLIARGEPGHGSMPRVDSSVTRLVRALENIRRYEFEPRIVDAVDDYFKAIAEQAEEDMRYSFANMKEAIQDREFLQSLQLKNPFLHALTRNTCSMTILQGSSKINVVPPEAIAELDCRVLPDQDIDEFITEIGNIINDSTVEIDKIMSFTPAISSTESELYRAIVEVGSEYFPGSKAIPSVSTGFTDSHFFRDLGIQCYGFNPFVIDPSESQRFHGNDERLSLENIRRGASMMLDIVRTVVVD